MDNTEYDEFGVAIGQTLGNSSRRPTARSLPEWAIPLAVFSASTLLTVGLAVAQPAGVTSRGDASLLISPFGNAIIAYVGLRGVNSRPKSLGSRNHFLAVAIILCAIASTAINTAVVMYLKPSATGSHFMI